MGRVFFCVHSSFHQLFFHQKDRMGDIFSERGIPLPLCIGACFFSAYVDLGLLVLVHILFSIEAAQAFLEPLALSTLHIYPKASLIRLPCPDMLALNSQHKHPFHLAFHIYIHVFLRQQRKPRLRSFRQ